MGEWSPKMERFVFGLLFSVLFVDVLIRLGGLLTPICNSGIAFGIVVSKLWLWSALGALLAAAIRQWCTASDRGERLAWLAIFLSGSVNTLDRLIQGCVTDYLTLPLFPSFNLADMMLFLGVLYLLGRISGIFSTRKPYVS